MRRQDGNQYDVFVSYRRENGAETAKHLRDVLTERGYRVFFDTDSLRSGDFNVALFDVIDRCTDFIIILSPGSLDRCFNEGDWVRVELARALATGKNVIPIMSGNFRFPATLPPDINDVRWKNGLVVNVEYFDAMIDKLTTFLRSAPVAREFPAWAAALVSACVTTVLALAVLFFGGLGERFGMPTLRSLREPAASTTTEAVDTNSSSSSRYVPQSEKTTDEYALGEPVDVCNPENGEVEYTISVDGVHILSAEFEKNMWEDYDPEAVDLLAVQVTVENYGYHRGDEGVIQLYKIMQDNTVIVKDADGYQLVGVTEIYHGTDGLYVCECTAAIPAGSKGRFCLIFYVEKGTDTVTLSIDSHGERIATVQVEIS